MMIILSERVRREGKLKSQLELHTVQVFDE